MKKVLIIDSCIRKSESRTKKILDSYVNVLKNSNSFCFEYIDINDLDVVPLNNYLLNKSSELLMDLKNNSSFFKYALQFYNADYIIVAAPFWDMSIPAKLKTYFENISVAGITFQVNQDGDCIGCCKAKKMIYITTRGMNIPDDDIMEQGGTYLRALSKFLGINEFEMLSTYGLDMCSEEVLKNRLYALELMAINSAKKLLYE